MKKIIPCFLLVFVFAMYCSIATAEKTAREYLEEGVYFEENNVYMEAIKMYTKAIELDGQYADAYFRRGRLYRIQDVTNCLQSIKDLTKCVDLDPENADAYYERGLLNAYIINNEQARKDMKTAASLGHEGAKVWLDPKVGKKKMKYINLGEKISSKNDSVVYFDLDRADIKTSYYSALDEMGEQLKGDLSQIKVIVAGYADSTGSKEYNHDLSLRRSEEVKNYLVDECGIEKERIFLKAYGEENPAASNDSEEGRSFNRRALLIGVEGF